MPENVILLFDSYHAESQSLHKSFKLAGKDYPAVVIQDDGFLPDGVQSVFGFFLGDSRGNPHSFGRPRYFNQIPIPRFWEITANNVSGSIKDHNHTRANIFYAQPSHKRQVKAVDWLDEAGVVRSTDHYNRFGDLYARTSFNGKGERTTKAYFSCDGKEIITENYVTRNIILNDGETVRIFENNLAFILFFLEKAGYSRHQLFFNSLSTPFFISCRLPNQERKDVLFWQENPRDDIPGNMQMILQGNAPRVGTIYVQKQESYKRLIALGADSKIVKKKGFVYPFHRENAHRPTALIFTNSDSISHCEEIVSAMSEVEFHIAAITEMSSKLLALGKYSNVHLYPGVKMEVARELLHKCDFYLDINYANEILSAVSQAFLQNQVILGFEDTLHNRNLIAAEHIFSKNDAKGMTELIRAMLADPKCLDKHLKLQTESAMAETVESFWN